MHNSQCTVHNEGEFFFTALRKIIKYKATANKLAVGFAQSVDKVHTLLF